jgi:hypothetical protein
MRWTRRRYLAAGGTLLGAGLAGCSAETGGTTTSQFDVAEPLAVESVKQYSGPDCSCCGRYATYLNRNVDGEFTETVADDPDAVKRERGVPESLRSCHTLDVGAYTVEGHVPAAAIGTLLEEQPDVDGIALPGMPAGSPGMGGDVDGQLTVYTFTDGQRGDVLEQF